MLREPDLLEVFPSFIPGWNHGLVSIRCLPWSRQNQLVHFTLFNYTIEVYYIYIIVVICIIHIFVYIHILQCALDRARGMVNVYIATCWKYLKLLEP